MKRRIGEPIPQMMAAERAAQASMNELVGEIRNSIQYFASLPGRLPVSRVLVTGGGSELSGLIAMLEAQVRLPVLTVSPLTRLDTSRLDLSEEQAREVGSVLATPIGLALPEPDKAVRKFNLIPPEVAQRARMKRIQERTLLAGAAVLVALALFGAWKFYQVHNAQNNVDAAAGEYRLPERTGTEVRPGGGGEPGLLSRHRPARLSAQHGRRLADCDQRTVPITPTNAEVEAMTGTQVSATSASGATAATTPPPPPLRRGSAELGRLQ